MKIIITERQNDLLMENIPVALRRRFNYDELKGHLDFVIENYHPCDYSTLSDFIGEMCDLLVNDLIDDYYDDGGKVDAKTKDDLYYFMVDNFADYLQEIYDKKCN